MNEPPAPEALLLVEDNAGDAALIADVLQNLKEPPGQVQHVMSLADAKALLESTPVDLVLLDLRLPDGTGLDSVDAIKAQAGDTPVVVVTGLQDDALAKACLEHGAQEVVLKDLEAGRLDVRLSCALARARETRERARAAQLRDRLHQFVNATSDLVVAYDVSGQLTTWNEGAERLLGYTAPEMVGRDVREVFRALTPAEADLGLVSRAEEPVALDDTLFRTRSGAEVLLAGTRLPLFDAAGALQGYAAVLRDVTEARHLESERAQSLADAVAGEGQLRALNRRLRQAREEERTQLSRRVHDELGQSLTALRLHLRWTRNHLDRVDDDTQVEFARRLSDADDLVQATLEAVAKLAVQLRPAALDALGLSAAVRDELERFRHRSALQLSASIEDVTAPPDVATAMFRVLQELLTNVVRHAEACEVQVSLRAFDGFIALRVKDDGRGLRPGDLGDARSLGILSMREQVAAVGGAFTLRGHPDGGTEAVVKVGLRESA